MTMTENKQKLEYFEKTQKLLLDSEIKGSSTRPKISWLMAIIVTAYMLVYLICMVYGIIKYQNPLPTWEEIAAILAIPSYVLRSYFQMRSDDKLLRASVSMGLDPKRPSLREAMAHRISGTKE